MKNLLILLFTLPILFLSGCGEVDEETGTKSKNKDFLKIVGGEYYLSTIKFPDRGQIVKPDRTDFTLSLDSENFMTGKIICNAFEVEVDWGSNKTLILSNFAKSSEKCGKADPLVFQNKMFYEIIGSRLILTASDNAWVATFVQVEQ